MPIYYLQLPHAEKIEIPTASSFFVNNVQSRATIVALMPGRNFFYMITKVNDVKQGLNWVFANSSSSLFILSQKTCKKP